MSNASNELDSLENAHLFMDIIYSSALALHFFAENSEDRDIENLNCIAVAIEYAVVKLAGILSQYDPSFRVKDVKPVKKKECNA